MSTKERITIRFDSDLADKLRGIAPIQERSVNNLIVAILREYADLRTAVRPIKKAKIK